MLISEENNTEISIYGKTGKIINEEEVILSLAKTIKDAEDETNLIKL